jgi:hypothetical protein
VKRSKVKTLLRIIHQEKIKGKKLKIALSK